MTTALAAATESAVTRTDVTPDVIPNSIKVRRMDFEFADTLPEFWFDNNPVLTAFLSAMSVSFPAGERYFIDSVRHFQARIDNAELKEQIRGFIGQEANHTKEHIALNRFMDRKGYPATAMENFVRKGITWVQRRSSPEENLARTAALEHFTAIIAGSFLDHPELFEKMAPELAKIWAWHSIEEVEHRSVAFDVYKSEVNDEKLRLRTMVKVTLIFTLVNSVRTLMLLNISGHLFNARAWLKSLNLMWGRPGVFRRIVPHYFAYYRKDFHPAQHDYHDQVEAAKSRYLGDKA